METLLGVLAIIAVAVIFGIILNPFFWQGFRNSKFWDEQKKNQKKSGRELIDPDNNDL